MAIPFVDLKAQYAGLKEDIDARIQRVFDHGSYIMGPEVAELEKTLGAYVGAKHAMSCSSGTDALLLALMAAGVGPGDAVFTTPFTFIATAEVISLLDATPVFVDIDPLTYNIDATELDKAIRALKAADRTIYPLPLTPDASSLTAKAVIAVDLYGLPADYDALQAVCTEHGLFLLEDAAQSFGAEYKGKKACAFGDAAATSFFPAKPLGCYGDGGMVFTDRDDLAEIMRSLRVHGKGTDKYDNVRVGLNARMDTLQAAIVLAKFEVFPEEVEKRQEVARRYTELLKGRDWLFVTRDSLESRGLSPTTNHESRITNHGISESPVTNHAPLVTPHVPGGSKSAWAQYTLRLPNGDRKAVQEAAQKAGVPTMVYYPKPLHLQTAFAGLGYVPGAFPESEKASEEVLSLPFGPYLDVGDQKKVAVALHRAEPI